MNDNLNLPMELDAPEKQQIGIGIFYGFVTFFGIPFFIYFLMADLQDPHLLAWFEFAFHMINFGISIAIFREYLADALFIFRLQIKEYFFTIRIAVLLILAILASLYMVTHSLQASQLFTAMISAFPLSEMEILFIGGDFAYYAPLLSLLNGVVLAPLTCACLFYSISFAPASHVRPWLGYVAVVAWLAFTHLRNAVTYWDLFSESILFAVHLPVHLVACWSYKKTNNICTPILIIATVNLIAWIYLMVQFLLT